MKHSNIVKVEDNHFITTEGISNGIPELVIVFEMAETDLENHITKHLGYFTEAEVLKIFI